MIFSRQIRIYCERGKNGKRLKASCGIFDVIYCEIYHGPLAEPLSHILFIAFNFHILKFFNHKLGFYLWPIAPDERGKTEKILFLLWFEKGIKLHSVEVEERDGEVL